MEKAIYLTDGAKLTSKLTVKNQAFDWQGAGQDPNWEFVILPPTLSETHEISESPPKRETEPSEVPATLEAEDVPLGEAVVTVETFPQREPTEVWEENLEAEVMEPLKLEITQLKIYLPLEVKVSGSAMTEAALEADQKEEDEQEEKVMIVDATRRILMGNLPPAKPFDLEVCFQLTGKGALELTQHPLPYQTEVYGEKRKSQQKITLDHASVGNLVDGELAYTCRLTGVNLPQAGTYRLQIVAHMEEAPVSPDLLELPFVQVA